MDSIEGTTEGGRNFKIEFMSEFDRFHTQIFSENGDVYEPMLRISDILKNNILSVVNKIDETFFVKRINHASRTQRKSIFVEGSQEQTAFTLKIKIENNWVSGRMQFKKDNHSMDINRSVPDHIPANQKHHWLYLHYQKPETLVDVLKFNIKDKYFTCCGNNILGRHNYCSMCGKKQEVVGLEIDNVVGTELLTLLT
jgi:hypothetical protein